METERVYEFWIICIPVSALCNWVKFLTLQENFNKTNKHTYFTIRRQKSYFVIKFKVTDENLNCYEIFLSIVNCAKLCENDYQMEIFYTLTPIQVTYILHAISYFQYRLCLMNDNSIKEDFNITYLYPQTPLHWASVGFYCVHV
jgi:hypothetical protein